MTPTTGAPRTDHRALTASAPRPQLPRLHPPRPLLPRPLLPRPGLPRPGSPLLAVLALLLVPVAAANPLAELLTRFDAAYEPPDHLVAEAADLAAVGAAQAGALAPGVAFDERLAWSGYGALELSLGLDADIPLYSARAAPRAELQRHRQEALEQRAAAVRATARAQFASDVVSLALASELATAAGAALRRFRSEVWSPPDDLEAAARLPPRERELLSLHADVAALEAFALDHARQLRGSVNRALVDTDPPLIPTFAEVFVAFDRTAPSLEACLATAPEAQAARMRHRQRLLAFEADAAVDLEVGLFAHVGYQVAWPAPGAPPAAGGGRGGQTAARLGVTANLALPDGWPLSGAAGVTTDLAGAEQTLRLTWPPVRRVRGPLDIAGVTAEADAALAAQLEQVVSEVSRLLRTHRDALAALRDAELRLLWLAADTDPESFATDHGTPWELAERPFEDPVRELHAVMLRADVAFARLTLLTNLFDLQVACGSGELGDRRETAQAR